ncbi:MAG: bifunctional UDP-N-acetylglucosamine diphosphorylase/glucosamine-1-phosphate N-acetyltransferase GlmU [Nitratireductor sp.]|nr:bifunctional UDP-N-acetylglucosamine diphosphorylase/glucosamine-1-phosphate N-acetyltransferase GlmU [Nitratireductor sp.]
MARTCLTIILAAGEGTRMRSRRSKVLHEVAGLSLLGHVMRAAGAAGGEAQVVVVGRNAAEVEAEARRHAGDIGIVEQTERLGTGHAVLAARQAIARGHDDVLVVFGDSPLLTADTLTRLRRPLAEGAAVAVLGFRTQNPHGYGRLIEKDGELVAIREEKDATQAERRIDFCNGGIMGLAGAHALALLEAIGNDNAKGEYYLTDCVEIARARGLAVRAIEADAAELLGVNDRGDLAAIEALWQQARRRAMLLSGVSLQAPETVYFSHDTEIGADTLIEPHVWFGPGTRIGEQAEIRAFSHIEGAALGDGAVVGPFARIRPGSRLEAGAKVGNFCETKNALIEAGAKVNHLSYIGDARVGAKANIGAGTITCNYDGANKFFTDIGRGAFIGSDSALVAPVTIGDGAYVASGSVIVADVPADALAIARGRQVNKDGYGKVIRERNAAIKAAGKAKPKG